MVRRAAKSKAVPAPPRKHPTPLSNFPPYYSPPSIELKVGIGGIVFQVGVLPRGSPGSDASFPSIILAKQNARHNQRKNGGGGGEKEIKDIGIEEPSIEWKTVSISISDTFVRRANGKK
jgi:hypothetical protein